MAHCVGPGPTVTVTESDEYPIIGIRVTGPSPSRRAATVTVTGQLPLWLVSGVCPARQTTRQSHARSTVVPAARRRPVTVVSVIILKPR
jgi:hypothetical protein